MSKGIGWRTKSNKIEHISCQDTRGQRWYFFHALTLFIFPPRQCVHTAGFLRYERLPMRPPSTYSGLWHFLCKFPHRMTLATSWPSEATAQARMKSSSLFWDQCRTQHFSSIFFYKVALVNSCLLCHDNMRFERAESRDIFWYARIHRAGINPGPGICSVAEIMCGVLATKPLMGILPTRPLTEILPKELFQIAASFYRGFRQISCTETSSSSSSSS